jgi:hypothetical protein
MAGAIGWAPSEIRDASLAQLWACWIGFARTQGWLDQKPKAAPMTRKDLAALIEKVEAQRNG